MGISLTCYRIFRLREVHKSKIKAVVSVVKGLVHRKEGWKKGGSSSSREHRRVVRGQEGEAAL